MKTGGSNLYRLICKIRITLSPRTSSLCHLIFLPRKKHVIKYNVLGRGEQMCLCSCFFLNVCVFFHKQYKQIKNKYVEKKDLACHS